MSGKILRLGLLLFLAFSPSIVTAMQRECYSNIGELKIAMSSQFQSPGLCESHCGKLNHSIYGIKGDRCWCGDKLPPTSARIPYKECNEACPGYPGENCGGDDVWTVISDSSTNPEHSKPKSSSIEPKSISDIRNYPMGTLNVNPTVVQTGAAFQTSMPKSILTAPTSAPKHADIAEAAALAATQSSSSSSSSPSSSTSTSADPESSSNVAVAPTGPASVGSLVGAILLPLVLGSAF